MLSIHILIGAGLDSQVIDESTFFANQYGRDEGVNGVANMMRKLGHKPHIHNVTLENYERVLDAIEKTRETFILFNLCDGIEEEDGYPGISVLKAIEARGWKHTGADSTFYHLSTSKPPLKRVLIDKGVETLPFTEIHEGKEEEFLKEAEAVVGYPMIVKPNVSYGSLNISDTSVAKDRQQALDQFKRVFSATRLGLFVEKSLPGREFTALVVGDREQGVTVFPVVERVFNKDLPEHQRILGFERYWSGYDLNGGKPRDEDKLYVYRSAPEQMMGRLMDLARDAYLAMNGNGYSRVDLRSDSMDYNAPIYVLEVNANCSLSFDQSSSAGEILNLAGVSFEDFAQSLVQYAMNRG